MGDEEEKPQDSKDEAEDEHISTSEVIGGSVKEDEVEIHVVYDTYKDATICQVCGMSFSSYNAYQIHFKNQHG